MHTLALSSYIVAVCSGLLVGIGQKPIGTDAYPHNQSRDPGASGNGSLTVLWNSSRSVSKRRKPRSTHEEALKKMISKNELCEPLLHDSFYKDVRPPHCTNIREQDPNNPEGLVQVHFAKLKEDNWYRLNIISSEKKVIKFLAISALSASHHYIGTFSTIKPSKTKSADTYTPAISHCKHPQNVNKEWAKKVNSESERQELKRLLLLPQPLKYGLSSLHVNFELPDKDERLLGMNGQEIKYPEMNKFIFIISMQEGDDGDLPGDCLINQRSKVYSLGLNTKTLDSGNTDENIKEFEIPGTKTFDEHHQPVISPLSQPFNPNQRKLDTNKLDDTTKSPVTTKPADTTKPTTTTARTTTPVKTKQPFPWKTVEPLVTDPNALLPEFHYPTPKGYGPPLETTKKSKTKDELAVNTIYHGCGKKKGCIGEPPGCVKTKSCSSVVTYGEDDDYVKFELMGRAGKYVAIGLSWDRFMGNDSVMECVREYRTQVNAYVSWNFPNRKNSREENQESITGVRGKYENGNIMCEFWKARVSKPKHYEKNIDLGKETFYVLQALGNTALEGKFGNIGYHSEGYSATMGKYNLHTRFRKTKLRLSAEKLHGILMLFAWLYCFPLAAFLSRYYKETYKDRNCGGYTIWYAWHVIIAWFGLGANFLAMICTAIGMELWNRGLSVFDKYVWHFHNKCGMALLALCFISLIAGYAIKRLNRTRRCQVMNYTHGVVGLVSIWLAITIIYRTTRLDGGLPCGASGLVVTWIVFYIILHIFMSYMVCYVDFVQGERVSRAYNIFLLRTAPHPPYEDVTGSPIRKCFLCIYVSIFSLLTSIIILMHVFRDSCVDETVD